MKVFFSKSGLAFAALVLSVLSLVSCSNNDYLNAIPANSIAVIAVDVPKIAAGNKGNTPQLNLLKNILKVENPAECGIDVTSKLYLFESADNNLGLVARVSDEGNLNSWLNKLAESGYCEKTSERGGHRFTTIKGAFVAGFSGSAAVIMGPTIASQQASVRQQIAKYLEQDEEDGIKSSPLFLHLDSIYAPIALVSQAAALPDKLAAPLTLGAPKGADASQIIISAGLKSDNNDCLKISGKLFSFNSDIDKAIKKSMETFRPITRKYIGTMDEGAAAGAFMNVDGKKFIETLHANKSFMALLAGVNTAIDIDNIIKSVNGDMAIVIPQFSDKGSLMQMGAQLGSKDFLSDIGYWKQSCPKGGRIIDWNKDAYYYTDGSMSYYFGVTADLQYYSGGASESAKQSINTAPKPLSNAIQSEIEGKRLCIVLNIATLLDGKDEAKALLPLVKPLLGNVNKIIYSIK